MQRIWKFEAERAAWLFFATTVCLAGSLLTPVTRAQQPDGRLEVYSLNHAEPAQVRRMLNELIGDRFAGFQIFADAEARQLVVRGPDNVQRIAAELIERVDQPPAAEARADQVPELKTYRVAASQPDRQAEVFRRLLGPDARITIDQARGQIIVVATAEEHRRLTPTSLQSEADDFSRWPQHDAVPIAVADPARLFPQTVRPSAVVERGPRDYQLRSITAAQCQQALKRLLGRNLQSAGSDQLLYSADDGRRLMLTFEDRRQFCRLDGDQHLVDQFVILLDRFEETRTRDVGQSLRFVPLRNVRPEVLNRAIRVWRETSQERRPVEGTHGGLFRQSPFRPAAFAQDAGARDEADDVIRVIPAPDAIGIDEDDNAARRPSSDVDVQPLPDLDVLILRGRDPDVEELIRIIQEIERLSEETAPEIEVYFLQHVAGEPLEELISQVLDELTGPLQGRISITPIGKPNALLLIGWGEAVTAAKKLIARLDRPVTPESQMRVFALKHASANSLSQTIEQFLSGRGGLGPDVRITANTRTNSLIVNAAPRDMQEVVELIQRLDVESSASVNQARMIRLKHTLASDVAQTVTAAITAARGGGSGQRSAALEMLLVQPNGEEVVASGLLDGITLTPDQRTNSIFITGPAESLLLVERLIEQLDESPAASGQIKVFQVTNGDASDLVTVLRSLFPEAATSTVPQLATAEDEPSLVPVRFSVDVRTNAIIATGTAGDLDIVEALLLRLDQAESKERVNRVYRLKNSPATDVARAVNDFLRSERIVTQAAPGRQNPFEQIEREVVVVPEPVRNSLIISATPRYFEQILELVEDLDDQPPQVMIQVILAEVDLNNVHEFGVELGLQDSLLFDRSLLGDLLTTSVTSSTSTPGGVVTTTADTIVGATNTPGFDFNNQSLGNSGSTLSRSTAGDVAGQALSHFSVGRTNTDLGYGGLVLSASSANVSVLLRALDESGSFEVLSRPQIMTLDNQQAFIQVGQRVPRIVNSQLTQLGQINSLALEDVGLLLGVTPRISPDGNVVMEIDAEKSEVGPEREGIPISVSAEGEIIRSPRVDVATAQTTVSAASGQTIVIGGLISNSNMSISRKVPWLGDLPVLGNLFRFDGQQNRRTELLIILTPHVILGQSEAEYLKQVEMARMSWVSCDVFNWLNTVPGQYEMADDAGVPVYYPDETPHVPSPANQYLQNSQREPAYPAPFESDGFESDGFEAIPLDAQPPQPGQSGSSQRRNDSMEGNGVRPASFREAVEDRSTKTRKRRFGWSWGADK